MSSEKKYWLKKAWKFVWEEESVLSWIVNIIIAFILIKFIVYPGLGLVFATSHPIVAVVSSSMEHQGGLDEFWNDRGPWYSQVNLEKSHFTEFPFKHGFNKGDIMVLYGTKVEKLKTGDVIVFQGGRDPIIHRIVKITNQNGNIIIQTKGDNNSDSIKSPTLDETRIREQQIIGRAVLRIPWLGYIKIGFVELLNMVGG